MLFIIYSCKKNIEKAEILYNLVKERITWLNFYIIYGDINIENDYEIKDNKYLILKCGDNYENLCEKTITLCKVIHILFPNTDILKCDDDIFPNIIKLIELIKYIEMHSMQQTNIDYLGNKNITEKDAISDSHFGKCSENVFNVLRIVHKAHYASGPLYYLSSKSINILSSVSNINSHFFEDNMVGYILQQNNINIENYQTYYNYNEYYLQGCIQNMYKNSYLFIRLHGGLGNQLSMVSAAYELSKKHNRLLVLLYNHDYKYYMTHNNSGDEFLKTIFNYFNYTCYENIDMSNVIKYQEDNCFEYNDAIIISENNYVINGYFHNKKYIEGSDILNIFRNNELCSNLQTIYPFIQSSYFIHMRRGDYVNNPLYTFDMDTYYKKAIEYIININPQAQFSIFSDDIEFIKTYSIFDNIHKIIIDESNTLNSFYLMSMCMYGGICCNSTFSGWASKMNINSNKIIIMPKQWINVTYEYEIPFEYTVAL